MYKISKKNWINVPLYIFFLLFVVCLFFNTVKKKFFSFNIVTIELNNFVKKCFIKNSILIFSFIQSVLLLSTTIVCYFVIIVKY